MIRDGQTYMWIPSILTLSTLNAEAVAIINQVHNLIGRPTVTELTMNPYIMVLNDLDMGGAPFMRDKEVWTKEINGVEIKTPMAVCGPIKNLGYLPLSYVSLIVMFGGDIEGLPVFFELNDITAKCPFSPAGPEQETWETWGTYEDSHKPVKYGEKWYRTNNVGESGAALDASSWVPLKAVNQLSVITKKEYEAIVKQFIVPPL